MSAIGCVVSIGFRSTPVLDTRSLKPIERTLLAIMTEAEATSEEVLKSSLFQRMPVCFRFRVNCPSFGNTGWEEAKLVTESYLSSSLVREQVLACSSMLSGDNDQASKLKRAELESFFTSDDDYPSESSLQDEGLLSEGFIETLYHQQGMADLFEIAVDRLVCHEFQNEFAMLLRQFIEALISTARLEQDSLRISSLRSVANARKWLARLLWTRIVAAKSDPLREDNSEGTKRGVSEPREIESSSISSSAKPRTPPKMFERYFQGALYEDFACRLRLSVCRSFLQTAVYDQDYSTMSLLLSQCKGLELSGVSLYSSLQSLLTHSTLSTTDLEAEKPFELESLYCDEEGGYAHMAICGWEVPTFLSLPILSLLGNEPHGCRSLIESYRGETGAWTDAVTDGEWHSKMSMMVEKVYKMIILTGSVDSVRAATCGDVVNELCGADLGKALLRDLIYAASNFERSSTLTIFMFL